MSMRSEYVDDVAEHTIEPRPMRVWHSFLIGVACALVGLLPWLITGMRLPLQNLWASETLPDQMPIALLPFSQYAITFIAGLIVTGAATAGLVARATRPRQPRRGFAAILIGVLTVQLIATLQTSIVVRVGLQSGSESALYFAAVLAVVFVSILVGMLVLWLIARAPRAGALVGIAIAAIVFGAWLGGLLVPFGTYPAEPIVQLVGYVRWVAPVIIGAAIAWCGINTVGRIAAAIGSLLILWVGPALITGLTSAAGSRALARQLGELLDYGIQVFGMALTMPEVALPPIIVAVAVAAIGLVGISIVRRSRREAAAGLPR